MILKLALRNLGRNRRRTLAILITVALGSGSLLMMNAFNTGVMNQYREMTIHSRYGHGQVFTQGYREKPFEKPWEHWIENYGEFEARLKKAPGVAYLFPRVEFFSLLTNGRITLSGRGQGVDAAEEAKFFTMLNVEVGEILSRQEDGIMLGKGLARALDAKPGDRITVLSNTIHGTMNALDLNVTGIFHTGNRNFDDNVFRIQLSQARILLDTDRTESVAIGLRHLDDWPSVEGVVSREFPKLEAIPFAILDKVYYQNSVDWLESQFRVVRLIILTIIVLGIFNTVSTGILERRPEIGNLRANGESVRDVLVLLLGEGLVLGAIGALGGIGIALLIDAIFLAHGFRMPPGPGLTRQFIVFLEFQPKMVIQAFVLGFLTTGVGTLLAAMKVTRLSIAEALRSV